MYERILVPVDGSATSKLGLTEAIKLAKLTGAKLMLWHAIDISPMSVVPEATSAVVSLSDEMRKAGAQLLDAAKATVTAAGLAVEAVLVETISGRIADLVVDQAKKWHADLIVIGTHGRRGISRVLLGSDAEQVVRAAPTPVLLVRARGEAAGDA